MDNLKIYQICHHLKFKDQRQKNDRKFRGQNKTTDFDSMIGTKIE